MVAPPLLIFKKKYNHCGLIWYATIINFYKFFSKVIFFYENSTYLRLQKKDHHDYLVHHYYLFLRNVSTTMLIWCTTIIWYSRLRKLEPNFLILLLFFLNFFFQSRNHFASVIIAKFHSVWNQPTEW